MNKNIAMVLQLFMALFLMFFGLAFLFIGRELYGPDASLIWVGGMLTYLAVRGIVEFIVYLVELNDAEEKESE